MGDLSHPARRTWFHEVTGVFLNKTAMRRGIPRWLTLLFLLAGCSFSAENEGSAPQPVLRLAVTTSTQDSGLLDVLIPVFQEQQNIRVDVISVGSGAALRLGEAGDVDVVLTHAPAAEEAFMEAGYGDRREEVMNNRFAILGPAEDPACIRDLEPARALQQVAARGQTFVSRGDESGTHKREQMLWNLGGGRPPWDGYLQGGQGMGATLVIADELQAYVLSDRATYLKFKSKIDLVPLITTSDSLRNSYSIMTVNSKKHLGVNGKLAQLFVTFMISPAAQRIIRDFTVDGEPLFYPAHSPIQP